MGYPTPLDHEETEESAELQEGDGAAGLKSCQRMLWSETNLQLACGTRCRRLRRVKDEARQVWMEYQEVTLLDNSRRFQWVSNLPFFLPYVVSPFAAIRSGGRSEAETGAPSGSFPMKWEPTLIGAKLSLDICIRAPQVELADNGISAVE
ncbi:uncharacterized protein EMH_0024910 [Eimeria mitis]|uniref:Uncharacterized protein n=1 Tax=Eimeria mitis TaxID=44415 RepID=U6JWM5_9EIME|nr:uncharacterized protein EMH_0024910 [Eimeria mitis]CDJ29850.1 hypothetical protein, conserved [Eimeria mitis]